MFRSFLPTPPKSNIRAIVGITAAPAPREAHGDGPPSNESSRNLLGDAQNPPIDHLPTPHLSSLDPLYSGTIWNIRSCVKWCRGLSYLECANILVELFERERSPQQSLEE